MTSCKLSLGWVLVTTFSMSCLGLQNGAGLKPPLGWSTWKTCGDRGCVHDYCDEMEVKEVAEAMIQNGMLDLGYEFVLLDDCWAMGRDPDTNVLVEDPERFPSGMAKLSEWLHERNMKFGLYTSIGNETCSSGGRDIVVPGSEGFFELDAKTFADWQVDYVKLDFCGNMKDPLYGLPRGKAYHEEFASALVGAQGDGSRPIFLEVVAGYWFARDEVAGIANSWRFCEDHHDDWGSTKEALLCLKSQRNRWADVEGMPGGWPYLDLSMVGGEGCGGEEDYVAHCPKQTDDNYKVEWATWGLMQSPIIVSTDVREMTEIMEKAILNQELIQYHQDVDCPGGGLIRHGGDGDEFLFGRQVGESCKDWLIVAVNFGRKGDVNIVVDMGRDLGWAEGTGEVKVRDLWEGEDIGVVEEEEFEVKVGVGGCEVLLFQRWGEEE